VFGFSFVLCAGFKVIFSALHQTQTALYRDEMFRVLDQASIFLLNRPVQLPTAGKQSGLSLRAPQICSLNQFEKRS
jgi:hypothetical protein